MVFYSSWLWQGVFAFEFAFVYVLAFELVFVFVFSYAFVYVFELVFALFNYFCYLQGGSGDEDMTSLLDLLHSCPITNLTLRTEILRCLMAALKESHRY